jgi:NitT/TauT family transport system substrate-binding protein
MRNHLCFMSVAAAIAMSSLTAFAEAPGITVAALKGPSGIGMVRLFESPPQGAEGTSLVLVAVASADLMTAKLVSGEYEAGVLPVNVAAKLYNSGIGIKLAAIVGNGMLSFLGSGDPLASVAELKGRQVNVAGQGATPDYLFRKLLKAAGMDLEKDIRLDYSLPYAEAAIALASGKIEYAILPEPFATMAKMQNPKLHPLMDLSSQWTKLTGQASYPMTAFVVSAKLAAEKPQAVKALMEAYAASIAWVVANPGAAGALVEKHDLGLKAAIAAKAIPSSAYAFVEAGAARPAVEALLGAFLELAPASVGGKLPGDGFYLSTR